METSMVQATRAYRARLIELAGDPDVAIEFAQALLDDLQRNGHDLERAWQTKDAKRAALAAHSIKGLSGTMYAKDLETAAREVELAVRAGNWNNDSPWPRSLRILLLSFRAAIGAIARNEEAVA